MEIEIKEVQSILRKSELFHLPFDQEFRMEYWKLVIFIHFVHNPLQFHINCKSVSFNKRYNEPNQILRRFHRAKRNVPNSICYYPISTGKKCNTELGDEISFFAYAYDSHKKKCVKIVYKGCSGNANRFSTLYSCRSTCQTNRRRTADLLLTNCYFPMDVGYECEDTQQHKITNLLPQNHSHSIRKRQVAHLSDELNNLIDTISKMVFPAFNNVQLSATSLSKEDSGKQRHKRNVRTTNIDDDDIIIKNFLERFEKLHRGRGRKREPELKLNMVITDDQNENNKNLTEIFNITYKLPKQASEKSTDMDEKLEQNFHPDIKLPKFMDFNKASFHNNLFVDESDETSTSKNVNKQHDSSSISNDFKYSEEWQVPSNDNHKSQNNNIEIKPTERPMDEINQAKSSKTFHEQYSTPQSKSISDNQEHDQQPNNPKSIQTSNDPYSSKQSQNKNLSQSSENSLTQNSPPQSQNDKSVKESQNKNSTQLSTAKPSGNLSNQQPITTLKNIDINEEEKLEVEKLLNYIYDELMSLKTTMSFNSNQTNTDIRGLLAEIQLLNQRMFQHQKPVQHFYYFNNHLGKCDIFDYNGCGGNDNRFLSLSQCIRSCELHHNRQLIYGNNQNRSDNETTAHNFKMDPSRKYDHPYENSDSQKSFQDMSTGEKITYISPYLSTISAIIVIIFAFYFIIRTCQGYVESRRPEPPHEEPKKRKKGDVKFERTSRSNALPPTNPDHSTMRHYSSKTTNNPTTNTTSFKTQNEQKS
ncbi:hypothetical protein SNEBB_003343 [Seison nebaliae]|nr:hypothetical protein SNEBB_003343 [Seison nebaliae]